MTAIVWTAGSFFSLLIFSDSVVDLRKTDAIYAGCSGVFYAFVTVQIARRHESITKTEKQQK